MVTIKMINPQIHSVQLISLFERNINIRQRVFDFENALKQFFPNPFKIIPVPDDENPDFPRFEAIGKKSSLMANQNRIAFTQLFPDPINFDKAKDVFHNRIEILRPLLLQEKIQFIAIVVELKYFYKTNQEIFTIFRQYSNASAVQLEDVVEFSLFYARPLANKFYLNINNHRFEEIMFDIKPVEGIAKQSGKRLGIGVTLDMNTKLGFINKVPFHSEQFEELIEQVFLILQNKTLENYLNGDIVL